MRIPPQGWTLTSTVKETIEAIKTGNVTHLSLDHDLGDIPETGYDVLLWIEKEVFCYGLIPPIISVHSDNSSARIKMELAIKSINRF